MLTRITFAVASVLAVAGFALGVLWNNMQVVAVGGIFSFAAVIARWELKGQVTKSVPLVLLMLSLIGMAREHRDAAMSMRSENAAMATLRHDGPVESSYSPKSPA